jgi:hypothetical protein
MRLCNLLDKSLDKFEYNYLMKNNRNKVSWKQNWEA